MELSDFSEEEIRGELDRRAKVTIEKPEMLPIREVRERLYTRLKSMAESEVDSCTDDTINTKDTSSYMYEVVLESFYGDDIFDYFNSVGN